MPPRPTSVTLLCIFGYIIAGLSLLMALLGDAVYFLHLSRDPMNEALRHSTANLFNLFVVGSLTILLDLYLILACNAAWQLNPVGRTRMITYAWANLALNFLSQLIAITFILPQVIDLTLQNLAATAHAPLTPGMNTLMTIVLYASTCLGILVVALYPTSILIFFHRPKIKAAFQNYLPPEELPDPDPSQYLWP